MGNELDKNMIHSIKNMNKSDLSKQLSNVDKTELLRRLDSLDNANLQPFNISKDELKQRLANIDMQALAQIFNQHGNEIIKQMEDILQ